MTLLLDTSLWIGFTRTRSPTALKQKITPFVLDPEAQVAKPVRFELLRSPPCSASIFWWLLWPCTTTPCW